MRKPPFFIAAAVILFCLSPVRATADSPIRPVEGRQAGRPVEDVQSIRPFQPSESPAQRAGRLLEGRDLTAEQAVLLRGLLLRDGALLDRLERGELSDGDLLALIQPEEQAPERKEGEPEELPLSSLPNFRPALLERYTAWAEAHSEAGAEEAVLTVNMDLDRPFYDNPQEVEDPDSLTALVNKYHSLPKGYAPQVETLGSRYGTGALRQEAAQAFRDMADGARADGISLRSVSAYRSYQTQSGLYAGYLKTGKRAVVDTYSARAGHSEHQTGLALDINTASTQAHFENTRAYAWLQTHCAQYGFLLRYPKGKEAVTGYRFEPWHYRYVGAEIAGACMSQGITYEEYLAALPG